MPGQQTLPLGAWVRRPPPAPAPLILSCAQSILYEESRREHGFMVPLRATCSLAFATEAALTQGMLRAAKLKSTFCCLCSHSSPNNMLIVFYAANRCLIGSSMACW